MLALNQSVGNQLGGDNLKGCRLSSAKPLLSVIWHNHEHSGLSVDVFCYTGELEMIKEFKGDYQWLSNFWLCPVMLGDYVYPSTENAYQASKYPKSEREQFTICSPVMAKRLGRQVELPENWDTEKLRVMRKVLEQKFRKNTFNSTLLMATGDQEIIEGNNWGDIFWGVCDGVGENKLGKMLMEIRKDLYV